jgi:CheY-like chemotaxis protein
MANLIANLTLKMPILDGVAATQRIREDEKQYSPSAPPESHMFNNNRVPIFAVSASLPESRAQEITHAQFDGWLVKPIDFRRVGELMAGIWDYERRRKDLYHPRTKSGVQKNWEKGGWLVAPPEA